MSGHCEDCGTRLERAGCPNCSDEAFEHTEYMKNRWSEEDARAYLIDLNSTRNTDSYFG